MELKIFIDNVLTNNNKSCTEKDVNAVYEYICNRARKEAGVQSSIGIDDETVKQWILEYDPSQQVTESKKVEKKIEYKPIEPKPKKIKKDENSGTWGKQTSLFQ